MPSTMTVDEFMQTWNNEAEFHKQIEAVLAPAKRAVESLFCARQGQIIWIGMELVTNYSRDKQIDIVFSGDYYVGMGRIDRDSYQIPLEAALQGKEATIAFFKEEKRKEEEKARELGRKREAQDKEARKKQFYELKAEFEGLPSAPVDGRCGYDGEPAPEVSNAQHENS